MQSSGTSSPETAPPRPSPSPSTPSRKRFALTGRSHQFDSRIDAARGDLADVRLADRLFAPHYAAAVARTAIAAAPVTTTPGGEPLSELLVGEDFEVLEFARDHAWGVCAVDGTVGYVPADALDAPSVATHIVCAPFAAGADGDRLPMGSRVDDATAAALDPAAIRPLGRSVADYVALAEQLVGTPEVSGGRSGAGVDATGLVVLTLSLAGIPAPRFADLQAAALGHPVGADAPMLRGDLLYFDHHVAIVADANTAIHVGADNGGVMREAIASIVDGGAFGAIRVRRRLP